MTAGTGNKPEEMETMEAIQAEILLAAYNGSAFIREQIESILAQNDSRWHLTVSDDGSTDGTDKILDEYASRMPDKIRRVCSGRHFGNARDHFFWLMAQADADYVLFCDQDDVWYPEKVGRTLDMLLEAEQERGSAVPALAFSDQVPTDAELRPLAPSLMRYHRQYFQEFDYRSILMQNVVTGGAMGCNRALIQMALRCTQPEQVIMHDWWLAAVAARFGVIRYLDEPLGLYRQHGGNSVGAKDVASLSYILRKFTALPALRALLCQKKQQAEVFLGSYPEELAEADRAFLIPMIRSHSGPLFYFQNRDLIHGFFRLAGMMVLG